MYRNIFKKSITPITEPLGRAGSLSLCLLLAFSLFLGGCANSASTGKNGNTSDEPVAKATEAPEEREEPDDTSEDSTSSGESSEGSSSNEQPSENPSADSGDFDFNQAFDLKAPDPAAGESPRILFVGNSHTFSNDLPTIFSEVATAMAPKRCAGTD